MDHTKRRLLKTLACGLLLTRVRMAAAADGVPRPGGGDALVPSLPRDSRVALGRRYLRACPAERSRERLVGCLEARLRQLPDAARRPGQAALALAVEDDFVREDVVFLDGWALSRTEARLCALALV